MPLSFVLAKLAFGVIHQKHPALIHDLSNMRVFLELGERAQPQGVSEERSDFVLDRRNPIGATSERKSLTARPPKPLSLFMGSLGGP